MRTGVALGDNVKKLCFPIFVLIQQAYRSLGANP